jgi:hypothetical protein
MAFSISNANLFPFYNAAQLQNERISQSSPTGGDSLVYDGTQWGPTGLSSSGSLTGATGPTGSTGATGATGTTGPTGINNVTTEITALTMSDGTTTSSTFSVQTLYLSDLTAGATNWVFLSCPVTIAQVTITAGAGSATWTSDVAVTAHPPNSLLTVQAVVPLLKVGGTSASLLAYFSMNTDGKLRLTAIDPTAGFTPAGDAEYFIPAFNLHYPVL